MDKWKNFTKSVACIKRVTSVAKDSNNRSEKNTPYQPGLPEYLFAAETLSNN